MPTILGESEKFTEPYIQRKNPLIFFDKEGPKSLKIIDIIKGRPSNSFLFLGRV